MIFSIGRTWRLSPEPEYLTAWYTPGAGLGRIDDWDKIFRSDEADEIEKPFREVAWIERAGCNDPLLEPLRRSVKGAGREAGEASAREQNRICYVEFFEAAGSPNERAGWRDRAPAARNRRCLQPRRTGDSLDGC